MKFLPASLLHEPVVRNALKQAWVDSNPGVTGGHEEGGFILCNASGKLTVLRWPIGQQNSIHVPPHTGGKIGSDDIVASFHTHPNTGSDYFQIPSVTDVRAVSGDPNLKGAEYIGEFVISETWLYLILPTGQVQSLEKSSLLLGW